MAVESHEMVRNSIILVSSLSPSVNKVIGRNVRIGGIIAKGLMTPDPPSLGDLESITGHLAREACVE